MAAEEVLLRRPFRRPGRNRRRRRSCWRIDLAVYDPLLGRTYSEIGTEARSMHKCQGMAQLLALAGPFAGQLPARRIDHCRAAGARRACALRRCRHLGRRPGAVCGRQAAARPCRRHSPRSQTTVQNAQRRFDDRRRRRDTAAAPDRTARRSRAARAACRPWRSTRAGVSRSTSASARRSASFSRRFFWPTAFASKRLLTTVWWCRASPSACRWWSPTAGRRT